MFLHELKNNKTLWWAWGALLFGYFTSFLNDPYGVSLGAWRSGDFVCPPYFQNCDILYFFEWLPDGYSGTTFYMFLFALLTAGVWFIYKQDWDLLWGSTLLVWLWHGLMTFVLSDLYNGNFEYYLFVFGTVLLFFPYKEFFLKFTVVWFYVLSVMAKLHPAWLEGTYFTSLETGLPFIPDSLIPVATNIVIVAELVGAWALLSSRVWLQRAALAFFVFFHLYSGILVEYRYPSNIMPMLLILFGPWYRYQSWPRDALSIAPWIFMAILLVFQLSPKFIEGDEKLTLEGNKFGLYMFESNHQCRHYITRINPDGSTEDLSWESTNARHRCDPYQVWFRLQTRCERTPGVSFEWQQDHSINGDPYLRIVDTNNACDLEYKPFAHNEWIKTHEDNPEVLETPEPNLYY